MPKEMRGQAGVTCSFPEAMERVLANLKRLTVERVSLGEALGRFLVEPIESPVDIPPVANSAMDGYALSALHEDASGFRLLASPTPLPTSGGPFAIRVQTGHPVPAWSACVVAEEQCRFSGDRITVDSEFPAGHNIRPAGEDVVAGAGLLPAGKRLDPISLMRLASAGITQVAVTVRPKVVIVTTGEELVRPPTPPNPRAPRFECDSVLVAGLVTEMGGEPHILPHLPDDLDVIREALRCLPDHHLLITCGAAANSELDHIRPALKELGAEFRFERVQMKPARPTGFGILNGKPVFTLPGNPVATFVSFQTLVAPSLVRITGGIAKRGDTPRATLASSLPTDPKRHQFQRVVLEWTTGGLIARPYRESGSGLIRSLIECDGLLSIPAGDEARAGSSFELVWMRV